MRQARRLATAGSRSIRKQIEQLVQLNEGHPLTFDRATLVQMQDEALATARPRTGLSGT